MTDTYTIEEAIRLSLDEARRKSAQGLLVRSDEHPEDADGSYWSTDEGDRETIHSIGSLYSQFADDPEKAETAIWEALIKEYPNY